ncbi:hypothetical protein ACP70R_018068 [Stipagrostis hirtigluma subsp. patula]
MDLENPPGPIDLDMVVYAAAAGGHDGYATPEAGNLLSCETIAVFLVFGVVSILLGVGCFALAPLKRHEVAEEVLMQALGSLAAVSGCCVCAYIIARMFC